MRRDITFGCVCLSVCVACVCTLWALTSQSSHIETLFLVCGYKLITSRLCTRLRVSRSWDHSQGQTSITETLSWVVHLRVKVNLVKAYFTQLCVCVVK